MPENCKSNIPIAPEVFGHTCCACTYYSHTLLQVPTRHDRGCWSRGLITAFMFDVQPHLAEESIEALMTSTVGTDGRVWSRLLSKRGPAASRIQEAIPPTFLRRIRAWGNSTWRVENRLIFNISNSIPFFSIDTTYRHAPVRDDHSNLDRPLRFKSEAGRRSLVARTERKSTSHFVPRVNRRVSCSLDPRGNGWVSINR